MRRFMKALVTGIVILGVFVCGLMTMVSLASVGNSGGEGIAQATLDSPGEESRVTEIPTESATATARPATATPTSTAATAATAATSATATMQPAAGEVGLVTAVIDGDTIDVRIDGTTYRVRYIGVNTPETDELCGSEATAANAGLVAGREVRLVRDVNETDRYGRLLRYVYVGDTFVNGALVAGGWAEAREYPPDTSMASVLRSLESDGVGKGCALVATPVPIATSATRGRDCDPSYPTVCIPLYPPDLDCSDISYGSFKVLPPDPHGFDGGGDGVGCEGN